MIVIIHVSKIKKVLVTASIISTLPCLIARWIWIPWKIWGRQHVQRRRTRAGSFLPDRGTVLRGVACAPFQWPPSRAYKNMNTTKKRRGGGWLHPVCSSKSIEAKSHFYFPLVVIVVARAKAKKIFFFSFFLILCDHPPRLRLPLLLASFNTFSSFFFFCCCCRPSLNALPFSLCVPIFHGPGSIPAVFFSLFLSAFISFSFCFFHRDMPGKKKKGWMEMMEEIGWIYRPKEKMKG